VPEALRESWAAVRASMRNPGLRRLQLGWTGSAVGWWAAAIALTAFSYEAGGAAAVGLQVVMRLVPSAIASPLLSTFADRRPRVPIMVAADLGRVAALLLMAVLVSADVTPVLVYLCSAVSGVMTAAFEPAKSALIPDLVEHPDELTAANVVSSTIDSTSFFVGPAIGGLLLALTSPAAVLAATAAGFLWSALLIRGIREPARDSADADEAHEPFWIAVRRGAEVVARNGPVRLVIVLLSAQTFVDGLMTGLVAAVAFDLLYIGDSGLGYLNAAVGVGGLVGASAAIALVGRRRLATAFGIGCVFWGLPFVLMGLETTVAVAVGCLAVVGLANTLVDVSSYTLLQRICPPKVMARVFGVLESLILLAVSLGAATAPVLIEIAGIEGALIIQGAVLPLLVLATWWPLRRLDGQADSAVSWRTLDLLRGVPFFAPLPAPVIERLAHVAERVTAPADSVVVHQGDPGDLFYVIAQGRVEVLVDGVRVAQEGAGGWFGEIALLRDVPRAATVRALEDLELVGIGRDDFVGAVTGHATSSATADTVIATRLRARPLPAAA
jgi:MFS family permease